MVGRGINWWAMERQEWTGCCQSFRDASVVNDSAPWDDMVAFKCKYSFFDWLK